MRFLKMFFGVLFAASAGVAILIIIYIDGSLHLAARQLRVDMNKTYLLVRKPEHTGMCNVFNEELGGVDISVGSVTAKLKGYRLRFVNDTEYVVEAICNNTAGPFEAFRNTLPWGVTKEHGSGVMISINAPNPPNIDARVVLKKHFRYLETGYREGELVWSYESMEGWDDIGYDAAVTTCEGWGDQCCSAQTQVGQGKQNSSTLDCKEFCYSTCLEKPYVVYFNSNPLMDRDSRLVVINKQEEEVNFGYEIADADGMVERALINYGDGVEEDVKPASLLNHKYSCVGRRECRYEAVLSAIDDDGLGLTNTRLGKITIVMRP